MDPIESELGITDAQKKKQVAIQEGQFERMQQARRDVTDRAKFREARDAILRETTAALLDSLTPGQRDRLDQIRIQIEGPLAFAKAEFGPMVFTGTPLIERLALSGEQVRRVRILIDEGTKRSRRRLVFQSPWMPRMGHRRWMRSALWSRARNSRRPSKRPDKRVGTPALPDPPDRRRPD